MLEAEFDVATPDGPMGVIAKHADGRSPLPVILVFHDGLGVRKEIHEVARRIAGEGFYAVVPDRYHRRGRFVHYDGQALMAAGRDSPLMQEFFELVTGTTDAMIERDVVALLAHLKSDPLARRGIMGCIGFCNGARTVLRTMSRHPVDFSAGVGFHPSFCVSEDADSPHLCVPDLKGYCYFAIGEADHLASADHNRPLIDELNKLGDRAEVEILPGADHGFAIPGPNYHEQSAAHAYAKAFDLFEKQVKLVYDERRHLNSGDP